MTYNPVVRYFTDLSELEIDTLRLEMAFAYCEQVAQPMMTVSDSFWLWWNNHWKLVDAELECTFTECEGLTTERCRAIHASRHRIEPLHRFPNDLMADRIINEIFIHYNNNQPA